MADSAPPRRPFQFRLRTLMIVVTLLAVPCAYVGWQAKIVRERKAFCDAHSLSSEQRDYDDGAIPWIRRLLGDRHFATIGLPRDASKELRHKAADLFPEARIMAENPRFNGYGSISTSLERLLIPFPDENSSHEK